MDRDGVTRARRGGPRWWRLVLAAAVLVEAARCLPALGLDDVAVECPPAFADGCGMLCRVLDPLGQDPLWSGRTEALLPWRSAPQSLPLFETVAGTPALDAADFGSGMAAGPRFSLFRHTGDTGAIEFTFLRVQSFQGHESLPTTERGYVEPDHGIYCCPSTTELNTITGGLSSALQSFELNRRLPTDGGWQWLTGFRWVQWNESLGIRTQYGNEQVSFMDRHDTTTFNDLYGWQVGGDSILYGLGGPFRIEGLGKAGISYNNAAQRSASMTTATIPPATLAVGTDAARAAFVGEVGLTAVYDVADWLSVRAGYAAFWLGGLATATNQLDRQQLCSDQPIRGATDTGGSVWVQGITLGLEARY
ncbi:MAG: hypothetical protein FJ286_15410 [Planctomycetes bacterium]|nr:hypothetical protein [Planctomycetota bacterium]